MKKHLLSASVLSLFLASFSLISCSSGDNGNDDTGDGDNSSGNVSNTIPDTPDSGNNNNSNPDNIIPGNTGGDNSNTGGDNGNTGGDNGSTGGDNGNTGGDNGNTGGDNGNTGEDNGNTGGDNGNTGGDNGNTGGGTTTSQWKLIFEDNFDDESGEPNPEYWTLAPKGDDTWNRYMSESYDQAYLKDGYLYLIGTKKDGEYLTGGIETRGKFSFKYGQVKCRARFLKQPQGNHTGIWMMPEKEVDKWPMSGEIDIMEHLDHQEIIYETVHNWWVDNLDHDTPANHTSVSVDNDDFNVYGVIWDENSISFTVNGEVKFTYRNENLEGENGMYQYPYTAPFYLILSQSLGGKGTWEGVIDDNELPAVFQIDWIKVWEKE